MRTEEGLYKVDSKYPKSPASTRPNFLSKRRFVEAAEAKHALDYPLNFVSHSRGSTSLRSLAPLWSPFAGGWQGSTFISFETPAATEGRLLK